MTNFFAMRCPECGGDSQIDIAATIWVRVTEHGTDPDAAGCRDHEYSPRSMAECMGCGHRATVADFSPEIEP